MPVVRGTCTSPMVAEQAHRGFSLGSQREVRVIQRLRTCPSMAILLAGLRGAYPGIGCNPPRCCCYRCWSETDGRSSSS